MDFFSKDAALFRIMERVRTAYKEFVPMFSMCTVSEHMVSVCCGRPVYMFVIYTTPQQQTVACTYCFTALAYVTEVDRVFMERGIEPLDWEDYNEVFPV